MLKVNIINRQPVTVMDINGEVDLYSSPEVRKELLKLIDNKTDAIVVHLRNVTYMDSSGIATLVEGLQRVGSYNGKFLLANLNSKVKDVFELSKLDNVFEIYASLEDALESVKNHGTRQ